MKFLPKELVREWSWRVDTGMPDYRNSSHLMELKHLLIERRFPHQFIDGLLSNLKGELLTEGATNRTEDLHEIFFAVAYAALEAGKTSQYKKIQSTKNYKHFRKLMNDLGAKLFDSKSHIETCDIWDKKYPMFDDKKGGKETGKSDLSKLSDAMNLAIKTKSYIDANIEASFKKVSRVFKHTKVEKSKKGTKPIADAVVFMDGEQVSISLKYGKAQFNSLSVPKFVEKVYGMKLKDGLLKDMYKIPGHKNAIETVFHHFIKPIVRDYKGYELTKKFTQEDVDILNASSLTQNMNWDAYLAVPTKVKRAVSHAYNHPANKEDKKEHVDQKRKILNNEIENFMGTSAGGGSIGKLVDNLEDALIYILRAEEKTNYIYAAEGGKKFAMLPSQAQIRDKKYMLIPHFKTIGADKYHPETGQISKWADYKFDVEVHVDGIKAFTFDILWRFASTGGQWASDLNHKGSKIEFHSGFAKAFGLPGIPKDVKVGEI